MFGVDDAALATLASGLISTAGSLYTNKQNLEYNTSTNKTNWNIAALNNATQIDMANTSHQREVADLEAAGLNPILSTGGSGSSTPSLTTASGKSINLENPAEGLSNSAKSLSHYLSEQYKAETEQAKADADYAREDAYRIKRENAVESLRSKNELMEESVKHKALTDLTQRNYKDSDGSWHQDTDPNSDYLKEVRAGILSGAKMRANENMRAWIKTGTDTVNSAGGLIRSIKSLKRLK